MKTCSFFFGWLLCCSLSAAAQNLLVNCSSVRNPDNSISIFADSWAYGTYTVKLIFSSLTGYSTIPFVSQDMALATVERGKHEILKAAMNKSEVQYAFQYRYLYYPGRALEKRPDSNFLYLLPTNAGNSLRVSPVSSLAERLSQKRPDDFSGTGFVYKLGDTICAARAGIVYECNDAVKAGETTNDFFKSERNKINIQQRDGSLCNYDLLAPVHLLVSAGDEVFPGTPLAVFNKESDKYMVLLSSFFLDKKKVMLPGSNDNSPAPSCYGYTPMHFYTGPGNNTISRLEINNQYIAQHPKEIIAAEMSKREKKKGGYL